jgi:hypothetical protein
LDQQLALDLRRIFHVLVTFPHQVPCHTIPEIWMSLFLEAKIWLLNERKCQQQEDDKVKKSLLRSKNTVVAADKDNNNPRMQNQ